jgi:hypothetical protein
MRNLIIIITLLASTSAYAGQGAQNEHQSLEERIENRINHLSIILDLTDTQVSDIINLQQEHISSVKSIRTEYDPVLNELEAALKEVRLQSEGNFEASKEAAKSIREGYKPKLQPMKEAINSERISFNQVLAQVFSEKQLEKFEALRSLQKEKKH